MKKKILYNSIEVFEILEDDGQIPHFASESIRCMIDEPEAARLRLASEGIDVSLLNSYLGVPDYGSPERMEFALPYSGGIAVYDGMCVLPRAYILQVHFIIERDLQTPKRVTLTADGAPEPMFGGVSEYHYLMSRLKEVKDEAGAVTQEGELLFAVMGEMVAFRDSEGRF